MTIIRESLIKKGTRVKLDSHMIHTKNKGWDTTISRNLAAKEHYIFTNGFHESETEAVNVKYITRGVSQTVYVHYRDLDIVADKESISYPKPEYFDLQNLIL